MFPLKVDGKEFNVPQSWYELPWPNYVKALNAQKSNPKDTANISVISCLTGIPENLIRGMLASQRDLLLTLCEYYWSDEIPMHPIDQLINGIDIGLQSWDKMNRASAEFEIVANAQLHELAAAQAVCKIYTEQEINGFLITPGKDLSKMSVSEALPYAAFFLISSNNGESTIRPYMTMNLMRTRRPQALKNSKRSNGSARFTHLRAEIQRSMTECLNNQRSTSIKRCFTTTLKPSIRRNYKNLTSTRQRMPEAINTNH